MNSFLLSAFFDQNLSRPEWHRASTIVDGVSTNYLYDGDNVLADYVTGAGSTSMTFDRMYVTPFLDRNLSMTIPVGKPNAGTYYYSQGGLGSVRTLTNATGSVVNHYDYTAFGEKYAPQTTETVENRYQYTKREKSNVSTLQYNRWRMYDACIGRWTARDPIGYAGGIGLYSYVNNNPIIFVDPTGLGEVGVAVKSGGSDGKIIYAEAASKDLTLSAGAGLYHNDGSVGDSTLVGEINLVTGNAEVSANGRLSANIGVRAIYASGTVDFGPVSVTIGGEILGIGASATVGRNKDGKIGGKGKFSYGVGGEFGVAFDVDWFLCRIKKWFSND